MMKESLWILLFLTLFSRPLKGQLEYAVTSGHTLYCYYPQRGNISGFIKAFPLDSISRYRITYVPILLNPGFPNCWQIIAQNAVVAYTYGNLPARGKALLKTFSLETRDSLSAYAYNRALLDSLTEVYGTETKAMGKLGLMKMATANVEGIDPIIDLYERLALSNGGGRSYEQISYDFIQVKDEEFCFFLRAKDQLDVWSYDYFNHNQRLSKAWRQKAAYRRHRVTHWNKNGSLDTTYTLPENAALAFDSLFFEGHFKVFQQKENTFIFNLKNGSIYYLGEKGLHSVGRVPLENYPQWILNKALIIEDQDSSSMLVFGEVERYETRYPFPNLRLYPEETALPLYLQAVK